RGTPLLAGGFYTKALANLDEALRLGVGQREWYRVLRAEALALLGRHALAAEEAGAVSQTGLGRGPLALHLARVYGLCARAAGRDRALPGGTRAEKAAAYGSAAVALLRGAHRAGWLRGAAALRQEDDLKPLRDHPEFQQLLRTIEGDRGSAAPGGGPARP